MQSDIDPASPAQRRPAVWNFTPLEHVARVIAVGAGKGGVGKSTVAVGIARTLAGRGKRVALLDADIYGPSLPRMLGLMEAGKPEFAEGKMQPHMAQGGVACLSIGFIAGDGAAVLRGPMITKALAQMLRGTAWGTAASPCDTLIVDLPPGTGDVQLSLAQQVPLSGAVIVTTPQEVAVADARKALDMFVKLRVPVLGVVENMSGEVFGAGGGSALAAESNVPFLGSVPLDARVREAGDAGGFYVPEALSRAVEGILP